MRNSLRLALMGWLGLTTAQAMAQEPPTTWRLSLGVRDANEVSRVFNDVPQEDRVFDNVNALFGVDTRTERARFGLFGRVGGNLQREGPGRDRLNYGGGFTWDYTPSSRTRSTLTQNVNKGFQLETLTSLGVLQPETDTLNANTSWRLDYRTSPRTTVNTSLTYSYVHLQTPQPIEGSQIVLQEPPLDDLFPAFTLEAPSSDLVVPDAEDTVLQILATEGLSVREITNQMARAGFGVARRVTQFTTLGFDLSGGYRTIDSLNQVSSDGAEGGGRVYVNRVVGATGLDASYSLRRSLALEPNTTIQTASGSYSYAPPGGRIQFRAGGGVSYYRAESTTSLSPIADVGLGWSVTSSTRVTAAYRRYFQQSLGFGRTLLIDFANASFIQDFGDRVSVTLFAGGSFGSDPLVEESRLDAWRFGGTVRYRPLDFLVVGATFNGVETEQARFAISNGQRRKLWALFATFSTSWH